MSAAASREKEAIKSPENMQHIIRAFHILPRRRRRRNLFSSNTTNQIQI